MQLNDSLIRRLISPEFCLASQGGCWEVGGQLHPLLWCQPDLCPRFREVAEAVLSPVPGQVSSSWVLLSVQRKGSSESCLAQGLQLPQPAPLSAAGSRAPCPALPASAAQVESGSMDGGSVSLPGAWVIPRRWGLARLPWLTAVRLSGAGKPFGTGCASTALGSLGHTAVRCFAWERGVSSGGNPCSDQRKPQPRGGRYHELLSVASLHHGAGPPVPAVVGGSPRTPAGLLARFFGGSFLPQ